VGLDMLAAAILATPALSSIDQSPIPVQGEIAAFRTHSLCHPAHGGCGCPYSQAGKRNRWGEEPVRIVARESLWLNNWHQQQRNGTPHGRCAAGACDSD
jgi:hypothetical protein